MQLLILLALTSGALSGSDTHPEFPVVPRDVVDQSEAANLIDDFKFEASTIIDTVTDDFNRILNDDDIDPPQVLEELNRAKNNAEQAIESLMAAVLIELAEIIETDVNTFIDTVNVPEDNADDIQGIVAFGRIAVVRGQSAKEIIDGRAHEFIVEYLGKVKP